MKLVNSLIQSSLLAVTVLWFSMNDFGLDALYGAFVSFSNTWLFEYFLNTQKVAADADAQKSFRVAIKSSVLRIFSLAVLTLIGLSLLALDPDALILSLVVGQVGFILDRFRQK